MKRGLAASALAVLLCGGVAWAQPAAPLASAGVSMADLRPIEIDAEGNGPDQDAAVAKALANAVAQATGTDVGQVSLTASAAMQETAHASEHRSGQDVVSGNGRMSSHQPGNTTQTDDLAGSAQGQMAANAVMTFNGGHVTRYQVLSVTAGPHGGFVARVHAVLALYQRAPSAADLRKSIAVGSIDSGDHAALGSDLGDQLVIDLTQTNRFAVLDRAHDQDYAKEIDLVESSDASPEAKANAGQALGADFILTGRISETAARVTGHAARVQVDTLELTGERVSHTTASTLHAIPGSLSAESQVIELSTRQIVLADRVELKGASIEGLAQHITDEIIGTIYPPRLLDSSDPTALVISQGGSGMHAGQRFRLMSEGAEMFDPYTHESLGHTERPSGTVEITDVEPRMSYARLLDGAIPAGSAVVLRPEMPPRVRPRQAVRLGPGYAAPPARRQPTMRRRMPRRVARGCPAILDLVLQSGGMIASRYAKRED